MGSPRKPLDRLIPSDNYANIDTLSLSQIDQAINDLRKTEAEVESLKNKVPDPRLIAVSAGQRGKWDHFMLHVGVAMQSWEGFISPLKTTCLWITRTEASPQHASYAMLIRVFPAISRSTQICLTISMSKCEFKIMVQEVAYSLHSVPACKYSTMKKTSSLRKSWTLWRRQ